MPAVEKAADDVIIDLATSDPKDIKAHGTFLALFITFVTDEYLPFYSFSYNQATNLELDRDWVVKTAFNDVMTNVTKVAGKDKGIVAIAKDLTDLAYEEVTHKDRFVVDIHKSPAKNFCVWHCTKVTLKDEEIGFEVSRWGSSYVAGE